MSIITRDCLVWTCVWDYLGFGTSPLLGSPFAMGGYPPNYWMWIFSPIYVNNVYFATVTATWTPTRNTHFWNIKTQTRHFTLRRGQGATEFAIGCSRSPNTLRFYRQNSSLAHLHKMKSHGLRLRLREGHSFGPRRPFHLPYKMFVKPRTNRKRKRVMLLHDVRSAVLRICRTSNVEHDILDTAIRQHAITYLLTRAFQSLCTIHRTN